MTETASIGAADAHDEIGAAATTPLPVQDRDTDDSMQFLARELHWLSGGAIKKLASTGPTLAARRSPMRPLQSSTFTPALTRRDRTLVAIMSAGWLASLVVFWLWWLEPAHRAGTWGLVINSLVLGYVSGFPAFFVASANRLAIFNPAVAVPLLRVAFVVTRAPSEPWPVARRTLEAMLAQKLPLPYHVWLCDEQPTSSIIRWCEQQNVRIASREDVPGYQRRSWPRRTRCKEGNLAYFYDNWGYSDYDVVAQLDCDHVPAPNYLAEVVRPFADPAVGYVAAPSVCDANAAGSWSARGRLYREATFHGPFQLGHSGGLGPLCIGSHYAVRTSALRQIGGLGPDLAEDFSTTFLLSAAGWQGAFAIDAEAHGDGPSTFSAMGVQEYQWSRSLTTILLDLVPRNISRLPWVMRFRFLYALSYYGLLVASTIVGLSLAPIAAVTGLPWINVNYAAFLAHFWLMAMCLILIVVLLRRRGLLRPPEAPIVSWESWLFGLTRWPFVALGIGAAFRQRIRPKPVTFRVTPKAIGRLERLPVRKILPFLIISVASSGAALFGERFSGTAGYIFLSCVAGLTYSVVSVTVPLLHALEASRQTRVTFGAAVRRKAALPLLLGIGALMGSLLAAGIYPVYLTRLFGW